MAARGSERSHRLLKNAPGKTDRPVDTATGGVAPEAIRSRWIQSPSFQYVRLLPTKRIRVGAGWAPAAATAVAIARTTKVIRERMVSSLDTGPPKTVWRSCAHADSPVPLPNTRSCGSDADVPGKRFGLSDLRHRPPVAPGLIPAPPVLADLRHLSRSLRRSPASAAAAVLTLSLTLGAGASIFAVVD